MTTRIGPAQCRPVVAAIRIDPMPSMPETTTIALRPGSTVTVRQVVDEDAGALQDYIRNLSVRSRYSRMLGATSELPPSELHKILHPVDDAHVALVVTMNIEGQDRIVGEARLVHDPETDQVELALSVDDRWQGQGLGKALFDDLQRRAASVGPVDLFGDTLRSNDAMLALAKTSGFALIATPDDWRLVRFHKPIGRNKAGDGTNAQRVTAAPGHFL